MATKLPVVVIVGPTASGKTGLAIRLAKRYGGEIICADSRTAYKGMDIGTAKPTPVERALVPHWGLDLVEPGEMFNASMFKEYADNKIREIRKRGHVPFLVGGTGLYVDAVVFDYQFGPASDRARRIHFEKETVENLLRYCEENNIELPENVHNKRYLIRAIEQQGVNQQRRSEPISNSIIVGITTEADVLRTRIVERTEQLFTNGVVNEAIMLGKKYGWDSEAMTGNIYPLIKKHLDGELNVEQLKEKFIIADWRLAKRQRTWLRRNHHINWLTLSEAEQYLSNQLA